MQVTIGGVTKAITLNNKDYTKDELLNALQSKIDAGFGANKAMVSVDGNNNLRFEGVSATSSIVIAAQENKGFEVLGLDNGNKSNKIDLNANIYDIKEGMGRLTESRYICIKYMG